MALIKTRSKRKATGGRYIPFRKKRKEEKANLPTATKLKAKKVKFVRVRGGNLKHRLLGADQINLYDPKAKTYIKAKIEVVLENPANRHYPRRNILTKGTIVNTEKGKARITNRPGQENTVNAILLGK
ncbi:30S ribosomal protein S8e [Candidatus Woesearchaeota archaeon]|nr:30S ribosomal protein S8e [Candidatus Woesearchaeota archaeon]